MPLTLTDTTVRDIPVITVDGDLDTYTSAALRQRTLQLTGLGHTQIVIDLTECVFLDATGLGVLVGALKRTRARGGGVALACAEERILRVFRITGLTKMFDIRATVAEAAASFPVRDLTEYPCPECGFDGPHPVHYDEAVSQNVAECGACSLEFGAPPTPVYAAAEVASG